MYNLLHKDQLHVADLYVINYTYLYHHTVVLDKYTHTLIYINSKLDITITNFIDNYNQLNMFRAIISPILKRTRPCLQLVE